MPKAVINNGDNSRSWSDPQVWQSGAVPKSNPGLTIIVGPSSISFDDIASPDPFVVKEVDFQPNQPGQLSGIQVNDGTLQIGKVVGNGASTSNWVLRQARASKLDPSRTAFPLISMAKLK